MTRPTSYGRSGKYSFGAFMNPEGNMGGCGGKKQRERAKAAAATMDGKFNSVGDMSQQKDNLALVTKLLGEIGRDGMVLPCVSSNDRLFLADCRIKLNQQGARAVYGWRQVESMVRIHKAVVAYREGNNVA